MRLLPVYDKVLFLRVQVYDWLFSVLEMLEPTDLEPMPIGTWEGKIKQADQYIQIMSNLKNHTVYQRILWEIDQARTVMTFVNDQKNN